MLLCGDETLHWVSVSGLIGLGKRCWSEATGQACCLRRPAKQRINNPLLALTIGSITAEMRRRGASRDLSFIALHSTSVADDLSLRPGARIAAAFSINDGTELVLS